MFLSCRFFYPSEDIIDRFFSRVFLPVWAVSFSCHFLFLLCVSCFGLYLWFKWSQVWGDHITSVGTKRWLKGSEPIHGARWLWTSLGAIWLSCLIGEPWFQYLYIFHSPAPKKILLIFFLEIEDLAATVLGAQWKNWTEVVGEIDLVFSMYIFF